MTRGVFVLLTLALVSCGSSASSEAGGCFDRLRPGPNSNTSRLDTSIDIPVAEWPEVKRVFEAFASDNGWSIRDGVGSTDPDYRWLTMCNPVATTIQAMNEDGHLKIGFGIIHMDYTPAGRDGWQPFYRDLHARLEARWPGTMTYVEGEFGRTIERPEWLGPAATAEP